MPRWYYVAIYFLSNHSTFLSIVLDPRTSLAFDAPPIAPYDDGFSTDSEDFNDPDHPTNQEHASPLSTRASNTGRSAAISKNKSIIQRQQTQTTTSKNPVKPSSKKKSQYDHVPSLKTEEKTSKRAADDLKTPSNGHLKPQESVGAASFKHGEKKTEEHCRNCQGYLTPLDERLKVMKTAALQQLGKGPPPSRQCCCCHITYPFVALTDESRNRVCTQPRCYMCNWSVRVAKKNGEVGVAGVKRTLDGAVKTDGERCNRCRGKLMPLEERLKAMKEVKLHHNGSEPPISNQCSCCHITYPVEALTMKSREPTGGTPICLACKSVSNHNEVRVGGSSLGITEASKLQENGSAAATENAATTLKSGLKTGDHEKEHSKVSVTDENCCKNCKGKLPSLTERLRVMKSTAAQLKEQGWRGSPPTRQCSCCFIMFPLASLTKTSRSVMSANPICYTCSGARAYVSATGEKTPSPSVVATNISAESKRETPPEAKKTTPEIIVIDCGEDDEEGELVEQDICNCCRGKLLPLENRRQMMKDAARVHGGKGPPPSRQCACCRISYPSAALTKKSRKMTRVVPICLNCCQSGGSATYEMLAVSDEFVEAFQVENPEMARQLLKKKENGSLSEALKNQQMRNTKKTNPAQTLKKEPPRAQTTNAQLLREFAPLPVYRRQSMMARKCINAPRLIIGIDNDSASDEDEDYVDCEGDMDDEEEKHNEEQASSDVSRRAPPRPQTSRSIPFYGRQPLMARNCINAPRLIVGRSVNGIFAASQTEAHAEAGVSANQQAALEASGLRMRRKSMPSPRLIIGNPVNGNQAPSQARVQVEAGARQQEAAQAASNLEPLSSRSAR